MTQPGWKNDVEWSNSILQLNDEIYINTVPLFGLEQILKQIDPFLNRIEPFPHCLLIGEPGLGKTHLARWIAAQRREPFEEFLCPVKPGELPSRGVALLDEAHRQKAPEWLFNLMEARTITILAATTRPEALDPPFASRFFLKLRLERYDLDAMIKLIRHEIGPVGRHDLSLTWKEEWISVMARASAGNPRQADRLVQTAKGLGTLDPAIVLPVCQITADGLTADHLAYLKWLDKLDRPTGLAVLSNLLVSDDQSVRELERLLIELGLVQLTSAGRSLTREGKKAIEALHGNPQRA